MRTTLRSLVMVMAAVATAQAAEVKIAPVVVSSGYFAAEDCTPESDPKTLNECLCKADIKKAQVAGLPATVTTTINTQLAQVPEQLAGESCAGKPASAPPSGILNNEVSAAYEAVYQSPTVLSVLLTYTTFGAGAAHPITGSEGYTFALATGKTVEPGMLLSAEQMKKANEFVHQELLKKYSDALLDETKARTEPYLTDAGCENCTLYYTKDGWSLRFKLYAVAPYAAGEPTVVIPTTLIPDPETLLAKK